MELTKILLNKAEEESELLESLIEDSERQLQINKRDNNRSDLLNYENKYNNYKTEKEEGYQKNNKPGLLDNLLEDDKNNNSFGFYSF